MKITPKEWMMGLGPAAIISILSHNGEARFVGGCVRDSLLNKKIKDIDIATSHLPETVGNLLSAKKIKVIPTGIKHGTVTAIIEHNPIEITTLRKDVECYGRHAEVKFTNNWQEDAARRDFTMNALSMDLDGNIYDYFNGIEDLQNGLVRFVGDSEQRIKEDYLRILRLFRFHAYHGKGEILPEHIEAVQKNAVGLQNISGERIQSEMMKIMVATDPSYVLRQMRHTGVLKEILPDDMEFAVRMFESLIEIEKEEAVPFADPYIRLAAMIGFSTQEQVENLCEKWKISNRDRKYLLLLTDHDPEIKVDITEAEHKKRLRKLGKTSFVAKVVLKWAMEKGDTEKYLNLLELADKWQVPVFPLSGSDIIKLGISEGKKIGELLDKAEEYWESEGYKPGKNDILEYLRGIL